MNKPVHLGRSILKSSKTLTYEFWYNYIKPKYQYNAKLCYMDTDRFIIIIKLMMFIKTSKMMLRKDLIHQIIRLIDHCKSDKIKKSLD